MLHVRFCFYLTGILLGQGHFDFVLFTSGATQETVGLYRTWWGYTTVWLTIEQVGLGDILASALLSTNNFLCLLALLTRVKRSRTLKQLVFPLFARTNSGRRRSNRRVKGRVCYMLTSTILTRIRSHQRRVRHTRRRKARGTRLKLPRNGGRRNSDRPTAITGTTNTPHTRNMIRGMMRSTRTNSHATRRNKRMFVPNSVSTRNINDNKVFTRHSRIGAGPDLVRGGKRRGNRGRYRMGWRTVKRRRLSRHTRVFNGERDNAMRRTNNLRQRKTTLTR